MKGCQLANSRCLTNRDGRTDAVSVCKVALARSRYIAAGKMAKKKKKKARSQPRAAQLQASERQPADCTEGARECWVCLEAADPDGAAAAPTGCACRGSAGHAHLSCLAAAALHTTDVDGGQGCPTCKQAYQGPIYAGLARARWALHRDGPEGGQEWLNALRHFALSKQVSGDLRGALLLREQQLTAMRRARAEDEDEDDHDTVEHQLGVLQSLVDLGTSKHSLGECAAALALLEEALPGCRRACGEEGMLTLDCMGTLAKVYGDMQQHAASRAMFEEATGALRRRTGTLAVDRLMDGMSNLGACLLMIGDFAAGLAVQEQAVVTARRVYGHAHVRTKGQEQQLALSRKGTALHTPPGACACGTLVGLGAGRSSTARGGWWWGLKRGATACAWRVPATRPARRCGSSPPTSPCPLARP